MQHFDVPATTRASFYVYNDADDVERLSAAIRSALRLFLGRS
jgi:cysteine desulfurase/selenocysteine lyase